MSVDAYPLSWPAGWKRTQYPDRARFKPKTIHQSKQELYHELNLLGATSCVISSNLRLRLDGEPMSKQSQPGDTGVAVYFNVRQTPTVLACDRWDRCEHNLWAIARHTWNIRAQQRWGVGTVEQLFAGYKALPSGDNHWWEILGVTPNATIAQIEEAHKEKRKIYHPDVEGGSTELFQQLQTAYDQALKAVKGEPNIILA